MENNKPLEQHHVEMIKSAISALDAGDVAKAKQILQIFLPQEEAETKEPAQPEKKPSFFEKVDKIAK